MKIETKEQAIQEMATWEGVNTQLYKKALYIYNKLNEGSQEVKPITKEEVIEEVEEIVVETPHTEKELYALNKSEQVKILKGLGETKIPLLEKGRVKKILELS